MSKRKGLVKAINSAAAAGDIEDLRSLTVSGSKGNTMASLARGYFHLLRVCGLRAVEIVGTIDNPKPKPYSAKDRAWLLEYIPRMAKLRGMIKDVLMNAVQEFESSELRELADVMDEVKDRCPRGLVFGDRVDWRVDPVRASLVDYQSHTLKGGEKLTLKDLADRVGFNGNPRHFEEICKDMRIDYVIRKRGRPRSKK